MGGQHQLDLALLSQLCMVIVVSRVRLCLHSNFALRPLTTCLRVLAVCLPVQAGLVKAKLPEVEAAVAAGGASLTERHAERMKKSGFIIPQEVPKHSWLRRGVGAPPNRYGIKPGRHWDGVDRGNGFERDMFKRQNEIKRQKQEAFMWAQEDM